MGKLSTFLNFLATSDSAVRNLVVACSNSSSRVSDAKTSHLTESNRAGEMSRAEMKNGDHGRHGAEMGEGSSPTFHRLDHSFRAHYSVLSLWKDLWWVRDAATVVTLKF